MLAQRTDCSGSMTRFTYDRFGQLLNSVDAKGQLTRRELNDAGQLTEIIRADGSRETLLWNEHGQPAVWRDPLDVTDEQGELRWSGHYGSFGEVTRQTEGFHKFVQQTALHHQPLRYAGQYADSETGLHYNLFRYYDPQIGRFTVQDPIGLAGGWNLYQYAPNPLGWIDPWGLAKNSCVGTPNMLRRK